jgi:hypothetical protein
MINIFSIYFPVFLLSMRQYLIGATVLTFRFKIDDVVMIV